MDVVSAKLAQQAVGPFNSYMPVIKPTPRVFLVGHATKPEVAAVFDRVRLWFEQRGLLVGADMTSQIEKINASHPDLVVVLGGDGSILFAVQAMGERQVPVLGVNLGKLGYLADFNVSELEQYFDQVIANPALTSHRMMLSVIMAEPSGSTGRHYAVNDCVIRAGAPFRNISLTVEVDGAMITTVVGDGIILSTPTGSTAHNMSCGGPILQPDMDAIILTPMGPHSLAHRPLVLGPASRLDITALPASVGAHMVIDGQVVRPMPGGTRLAIRRADVNFQHVRNPNRLSWETLVLKLKWGQKLV